MRGKPIEQAKAAITRGLRSLQAYDTFQVIRFSNSASQFGDRPVIASRENIREAVDYVENLDGGGGTMMIEGIKAALDFPHDDERLRFVTFLTDGFIGNESQILAAIHDKLDASRIFSFGVGSSPNRFLMNRMRAGDTPPGHCRGCGYDLRGTTADICTECGTAAHRLPAR